MRFADPEAQAEIDRLTAERDAYRNERDDANYEAEILSAENVGLHVELANCMRAKAAWVAIAASRRERAEQAERLNE